jgi:hypothetical protein
VVQACSGRAVGRRRGIISAVAWVTLDGTVPLVISIVAGGSIALRATLGDE